MNIYVINLKRNIDRRFYMKKQLEGLNFQFFDAVDGNLLFTELNKNVDHFKREWLISGKQLTAGELGVFFSHKTLWKKCIELDQPIIILEDDGEIINHNKKEYIDIIKDNIDKYEFIRLESADSARYRVKKNSDHNQFYYEIFKLEKNRNSLGGYAIHPNAAKKLLKHSEKIYCAVDNFIGEFSYHKMDSYLLSPYFVNDRGMFESTIEQPKKNLKIPLYKKVTREIYNIYHNIRQYIYFRKNRPQKRL